MAKRKRKSSSRAKASAGRTPTVGRQQAAYGAIGTVTKAATVGSPTAPRP